MAFGVVNDKKEWNNDEPEYKFSIDIPYGLSILARHNPHAFVPGITDIINGVDVNDNGDTINTVSYAERIERGKAAQTALRDFGIAAKAGDKAAQAEAQQRLDKDFQFFGYGYFKDVKEAIPPVGLTFTMFRIMVILGSFFLLYLIVYLFLAYKGKNYLDRAKWLQLIGIIAVPFIWLVSEAGWAVAEVGRQPWVVQDLLPTSAAISDIPSSSVVVTFWIFAVMFTLLLVAELSIMMRTISKRSQTDLETDKSNH